MSKWYPNRVDCFESRWYYCARCNGNGIAYVFNLLNGYPFYRKFDPCPDCEGDGVRWIQTVQVRDQLL